MFQCFYEGRITQVVNRRIAAEEVTHAPPGFDLTERAEGDDLKKPVFWRARLLVVAHVADHVLRDPIGRPEDVAELEGLNNLVVRPGPWHTGDSALKGALPV